MTDQTRRRFVRIAAATAAVGVAGCSEGGDGGDGAGGSGGDGDMTETEDGMGDMTETEDGMDDMTETEDGMGDMTETEDGMMEAEARAFTVRIENVAPTDFYASDSATGGGVWITPGAYGIHEGPNPVFTEGETASEGLEAIAEAGRPGGTEENGSLVTELEATESVAHAGSWTPEDTVADPNDPMGEVPGAPPIAPGGAFEFTVEAEPDQHFSFATMFVPSNDLFFAPGEEAIPLFEDGAPVDGDVTDSVTLWHAGTEPNQEPGYGDVGAPLQQQNGGADAGPDESAAVRPTGEVEDGYDYPEASDAIRVTVTPA